MNHVILNVRGEFCEINLMWLLELSKNCTFIEMIYKSRRILIIPTLYS